MHSFADHVGNACDPRGGVGGDKLERFFSFAHDTQASEWSGSGFAISDDTVSGDGVASWSRTRMSSGDGLFVLAQIASMTVPMPSPENPVDAEFSVVLDGAATGGGSSCVLAGDSITAREVAGETMSQSFAPAILPGNSFTLIAWRTIVLSQGVRYGRLICRVMRDGDTFEAMLTLTDDLISGRVLLVAANAPSTISSLSVYSSPGPKDP